MKIFREDFYTLVYAQVKKIPKGKVSTYGEIAKALGMVSSSRMVGYALYAANDSLIPCHRVVNRFGALTGKHHFHHPNLMQTLLKKEGVTFNNKNLVIMKKHFHTFIHNDV